MLTLGLTLSEGTETQARKPHIDLRSSITVFIQTKRFHPKPLTIERLHGTVQHIFSLQFMVTREPQLTIAVAFSYPAKTHRLTFDPKLLGRMTKAAKAINYKIPHKSYYKWAHTGINFCPPSCRHKAVSSICRPQTWKEQHAAAQTGHSAHHDYEQDIIHRCQVGDSTSICAILERQALILLSFME